ncbi:DNA cytosine methyltransferase [Cellulomonas denverensis]|uniref:DNA (cytosine-5-)-methyltransferase n=1 Tax=Cellulomonas denverensis TaxID=264297 RepID=A0A7X6KU54_9CELL|nr:DNA (cytosine-5-)-methyltransferase [Cellulomonas denverensis]NKY22351.1 DNA (cytosine-5-)-methyltransferase [Cellulomonas denverensis]GIG25820.1 DNA cytosine methyltransferase [Cellulomonas denverensis]
MSGLTVVEICAGAGGQALGLELAGFEHRLAVELDVNAAATLKANRPWDVKVGDVADEGTWNPEEYSEDLALLAGGVPCPPFSIAGKQLGTSDERDLFAWAIELAGRMQPRAVLLENVRGLSMPRFSGYRQHVKDRLAELGYWSDWKLLEARDFGVPQLRPRFILVALREEDARYFSWPEPTPFIGTVGSALRDLMAAGGWPGAAAWAARANGIAPTIVGGSKKHGGADLGPTRAKRAWAALGVDGLGVSDAPPSSEHPVNFVPKLTTEMVARIQGWGPEPEYRWEFTGRKTSRYRQIGNAFPPPVARAVGGAIAAALTHQGMPRDIVQAEAEAMHDPIYVALKHADRPLTARQIVKAAGGAAEARDFEQRLGMLSRDFEITYGGSGEERTYVLGPFKGFIGQEDHARHLAFETARSKIS